jgi:hypothetical protein
MRQKKHIILLPCCVCTKLNNLSTTDLLIQQFDFLQIPQIAADQPSGPTVWYIKIKTKINTNMEGKVGDHSTNKTLK